MSSKRGETQRKRPQRYQNSTVFKNDLHDKSDRTKRLNSMSINEVCQKCHDVIQWKIKYRKYKALGQPKSCTYCKERKVKKAYHMICRDCAVAAQQCAKCMKTEGEVTIIPPEMSAEEKLRLDVEMRQMIKMLPERKRRAIKRFMAGKKKRKNKDCEDDDEEGSTHSEENVVPTREELLHKIEKMKLGPDDEFYEGVADSDLDSDDFSFEDGED